MLVKIILLTFAIALNATGFSQSKPQSSSIESVIDKLERKLIRESSERLSIYDASRKYSERPVDLQKTEVVEGNLKEIDTIVSLEKDVDNLALVLSKLSDDVASVAQELIAEANEDTKTNIQIDLSNLHNYNVKKIEVLLNGYKLFKYDASYHVRLPFKGIALYNGPLSVGKHILRISGSFNKKINAEISIESEIYATIMANVNLNIRPEEKETTFILKLTPPTEGKTLKHSVKKKVVKTRKLEKQEKSNSLDEKTTTSGLTEEEVNADISTVVNSSLVEIGKSTSTMAKKDSGEIEQATQ